MNRRVGRYLTAAAVGAAAGAAVKKYGDYRRRKNEERLGAIEEAVLNNRDYTGRRAHIIGGGLASMAAAAYLIRDCRFPGNQITIYEGGESLGGSCGGSGTPERGFYCFGGQLLHTETCENFWELFGSIPSLRAEGKSVAKELLDFSREHPFRTGVRLVDGGGKLLRARSFGFCHADRMALIRLLMIDERRLDGLTVGDWFKETPHFFETGFWTQCQTMFAFQRWSSLFEFRRCLRRRILELSQLDTLAGAVRTPLNPHDSLIRPLETYLRKAGVVFQQNCRVTDLTFEEGPGLTVRALTLCRRVEQEEGEERELADEVRLNRDDLCIVTAGSLADSVSRGDLYTPAPAPSVQPESAALWEQIAAKKPGLGSPEPFFEKPQETGRFCFTVTCRGNALLKAVERASGGGTLTALRDSSWLLCGVSVPQPYFANQPLGTTVLFGYGLYPEAEGNYVRKPMRDCTGKEILTEYLHQLHLPEERIGALLNTVINVIPCYLPYAGAPLEPRGYSDRPPVLPSGSVNLAFIGQFVELPKETAPAAEYAVRSARLAVYGLMGLKKPVRPVTPHIRRLSVLARAAASMYLR